MPSRLPPVSGREVVSLLEKLGYQSVRQRGSHLRLRKITEVGEHSITVPVHKVVAIGTLNDILSRVSLWNGVSKQTLIDMLKKV
jgi:predicted RNA binding protein YcfA (HicA-like mRNA interferase family)